MMTQDEEPSINQISFTWPKGFYNDGIKIGLGTVDKKRFRVPLFPSSSSGCWDIHDQQVSGRTH